MEIFESILGIIFIAVVFFIGGFAFGKEIGAGNEKRKQNNAKHE